MRLIGSSHDEEGETPLAFLSFALLVHEAFSLLACGDLLFRNCYRCLTSRLEGSFLQRGLLFAAHSSNVALAINLIWSAENSKDIGSPSGPECSTDLSSG